LLQFAGLLLTLNVGLSMGGERGGGRGGGSDGFARCCRHGCVVRREGLRVEGVGDGLGCYILCFAPGGLVLGGASVGVPPMHLLVIRGGRGGRRCQCPSRLDALEPVHIGTQGCW